MGSLRILYVFEEPPIEGLRRRGTPHLDYSLRILRILPPPSRGKEDIRLNLNIWLRTRGSKIHRARRIHREARPTRPLTPTRYVENT